MSAHNSITIVELIVLIIWTYMLSSVIDVESTTVKGNVVFEIETNPDEDGNPQHKFSHRELQEFADTVAASAKSIYLLGFWSIVAIPIHLVAWFAGVIVSAIT